ncbi:hypothetical protein MFLAVUS_007340 [Mucor flavus]|uniref:LIM zinc-binding domain-containing protein n=1 Tax=Mucor flavus TaxID=439312 RepID=A0ABP9Z428_9FUNG
MDHCPSCTRRVYVIEKIEANGRVYHKNCFKCKEDGCRLTLANFHFHDNELFCPKHVPKLQAIVVPMKGQPEHMGRL